MKLKILFAATILFVSSSSAMDKARMEARVDEAVRKFGVAGRGVIVALIDRGIDWKNNDFRNANGTTRIESIFDLTDSTGANAANNPYKAGTIYTRAQIDAALAAGTDLAHRDAVGHGTATAGIAAGNGRNSRDGKYRGEAPKATIVVVKIVSGAAAHDDQPAEASTSLGLPAAAIDYVRDKARELGLPAVMLPNIGSVQGPMDGSGTLAQKIDATVGPGIPGLVFVTGSSDDGGIDNHAQASVAQGQTIALDFEKLDGNSIRLDLWYPQTDRYDVTIQTPAQTFGPYASPATNSAFDRQSPTGISYNHYGSAVTPFGSVTRREILVDFTGPAGRYTLSMRGATSSGGNFNAWLNTVNGKGRFLSQVVPGYTVWDAAAAKNNICPNDYVVREKWADVDGVVRGIRADRVGDLWDGSGIGPTVDGRFGIDISAPGNTVFTTLAPKSVYSTARANQVQDGLGLYTAQNAVSGASPQVTGIIGLMLELNPTLDAAQVKRILQQTARRDAYTGAVPNNRWGYGKIDALAALTAASLLPGARPYLSVDRNVISIDYPQGSAAPAATDIQLASGNGSVSFTASSSAAWLTTDKSSGALPEKLSLTANPAGLAAGDYSAELTVASADGKAVPQSIMVHLHVRAPGPLITSVEDGAAFGPGFANGSWLTIRGFDLAGTTRIWQGSDFQGAQLPTALDGVQVNMQGRSAYVYFISPTQLNVLAPDNPLTNTRFGITVVRDGKNSNQFIANSLDRNPEFFRFDGRNLAAVHADGTFVGPVNLFEGVTMRPAKPGDFVQLFGTGCGETTPPLPSGTIIGTTAPVSEPSILTIGGKPATVTFAGLSGNGLCQVNAVIPSLPAGDAEVVLQIGNAKSADGVFLNVVP
jgi:minor extracellular serine protease Vpr